MELSNLTNALITGANDGIGLALTHEILSKSNADVYAAARNPDQSPELIKLLKKYGDRLKTVHLDARVNENWESLEDFISSHIDKLELVINTIGLLYDDECRPEKKLSDLDVGMSLKSFQVNALCIGLLAKTVFPFLKNKEPSYFCSLSARVGSIEDNRSGGWYSYRASKAAHNMFMKNIAFELDRFGCNTKVLALHPGTVTTKLSQPFLKGTKYKLHTPESAAVNLLSVIDKSENTTQAQFLDWEGKKVDW